MIFRRRTSKRGPCVPDGQRVYAIGDIHGRLDLLTDLVGRIERDDATRPPARTTIVLLGDLIDRGPDSAGVIRYARDLAAGDREVRVIMGNHEEMLLLAASGDTRSLRVLMREGGEETLRSFGFSDAEIAEGGYQDLARRLRERIPAEDLDFLRDGEEMVVVGDYLFVHAGVRPGVALGDQDPADLRWIREEFLGSTRDHGKVVVHGHTPVPEVEDRPNRIGIDTGAHASGRLTAVGLEAGHRWFLATDGTPGSATGG